MLTFGLPPSSVQPRGETDVEVQMWRDPMEAGS